MSLNISSKIMDYVDGGRVNVPISFALFGPTQFKNLTKMIRTGVIHGNGVPATIAKRIRKTHSLPILGFEYNSSPAWEKCDTADTAQFLPVLKAAALATYMIENKNEGTKPGWMPNSQWEEQVAYRRNKLKEGIVALDRHAPDGYGVSISRKYATQLNKVKLRTTPEVEAIAKSIEDGTTTNFVLQYPYHV
jgi:hypothetical protein